MTASDWSNIILAAIASGGVIWAVLKGFLMLTGKVDSLKEEVRELKEIFKEHQKDAGLMDVQVEGHELRLLKLEMAVGLVEIRPKILTKE